jgi:hypothetical protein
LPAIKIRGGDRGRGIFAGFLRAVGTLGLILEGQ